MNRDQEQRGARCGLVTVVVSRRCRFDLGRYCVGRSRRVIMPVSMDGPSTVAVCVDMACEGVHKADHPPVQFRGHVHRDGARCGHVHHGRAPPHFHGDEESHGYDCARARRAFADRAMRKWQTSCQRQ
jgi:hypothetical protein